MGKSKRKPYYKYKILTNQQYWGKIRREWKQSLKKNYWKEDFYLKHPKEIVNDWDYIDEYYRIHTSKEQFLIYGELVSYGWSEEDVKKWSRK